MNYIEHESIHEAVRSVDGQRVHEILERNPSCVNNLNEDFDSPLHLIFDSLDPNDESQQADDRLQIMQLLIKYGTNVNGLNRFNYTPLHEVVIKHQVNGVKLLLENKADPNIRDNLNRTTLMIAVCQGCNKNRDVKMTKLLLDYEANPNLMDGFGNTVLDYVFCYGRLDYALLLLDSGAKVRNIYRAFNLILLNCNKIEPLNESHLVSNNLYRTFMKIFFLSNNYKFANESYSVLISFLWQYIDIAKNQLLDSNQFSISNFGYCCEVHPFNEDERILTFFKSLHMQGCVIDYKDSVLHTAVRRNNEKLVKTLLENKDTNVNAKNFYGECPLHLIFNIYDRNITEAIGYLLIEAGADWRAPNLFDETPFYLAVNNKECTLVNLMLNKIARVNNMMLKCDIIYLPELIICYTENDAALHELLVAICVDCEPVIDRLLDEEYNIEEVSKSCRPDITIALVKAIELKKCNVVKKLLEAGFRTDRQYPGDFSSFIFTREDKTTLLCLLWEFKDSNTISRLFFNVFYNYSPNSDPNFTIYLVLFYYAIDEYMNGSFPDLLWLQASIKWKNTLVAKFEKCRDDLLKMKETKLGHLSTFHVMTMELDSLVKSLNNIEINNVCRAKVLELQSLSEINYFDVALQYRLELALEKNEVMNAALQCFDDISENNLTKTELITCLPYKVGWNILLNFNMRDIKKLIN